MPDVPIATNIYTALTPYQARGVDYSFLGNLPDAYWAGQNQEYQQRQRNLFQQGVPSDLGQLGQKLLQAGGAPAIEPYLQLQRLNMPIQPLAGEGSPYGQQQQLPPSTSAQPGTSGSIGLRTPGGSLGAGDTSPTVGALADRARLTGQDRTDFVNQFGGDESRLADLSDPRTRNMVASFIKQKEGQLSAQPPTTQTPAGAAPASAQAGDTVSPVAYGQFRGPAAAPQYQPQTGFQVAQAPTQGPRASPPGYTPERAGQLRQMGQQNLQTAATMDIRLGKGAGDAYRDLGNKQIEQAQKIDDFQSEQAKATTLEKEQLSGIKGQAEAQSKDIDVFTKEQQGIQDLSNQAIAGQQKAQFGKQLTQMPGFYSGPFSKEYQSYQQFRSIFRKHPASAMPPEAFQKVVNDMLAEQVKAMGKSGVGRVLQSEVNVMRNAIASMGITETSNRALMELVQRAYQKAIDIGNATRNLPPNSAILNQTVQNYLRQHPLFSPAEVRNPALLGSKEPPPESAGWNPAQRHQWGVQNGLNSGDPVMFNGQLGRIP